jgi:ATP-binding cassette, subfamily B, bacterial
LFALLTPRVRKLQQTFRIMPALRLAWQAAPGWTIANSALLLIQGIVPVALLYLTKLVIDRVTVGLTHPQAKPELSSLVMLLAWMAGVTLFNVVCTAVAELVSTAQAQRIQDYMQIIMHQQSLAVDLEFYEHPQYHDTLQRAQQEATYRPQSLLNNLVTFAQQLIALIAMVGLLLTLHWGMAAVLFIAAIPAGLVRLQFTRVMFNWQRRRTHLNRQGDYLSWLMVGDEFAKEVRLFNLGGLFQTRFNQVRQRLYREMISLHTRQAIAQGLAQLLATSLIFAAYSFVVYQAFLGHLKIGDLVLYHEALQRGQTALRGLLTGLSNLYRDNLFLANLYEFLDLKPQIVSPAQPILASQPMQTGIVVDRVSFQYPGTSRWALKNVSLTIRPGEVIALVGENGSGKTSLIKLLCRLYDPTSGQITFDGHNLKQMDLHHLRHQFSVIFQDYVKYYFTASENIGLGNATAWRDLDRITAAAVRSGADAVIQRLPNGYDTMLGKLFDAGEELSIGQWQKVALARAFLRDSQIIVLDEPTSAMDAKAEAEVFQTFRDLLNQQTAILISHRLSTAKLADRIYVLDQGEMIEAGSHTQLMAQNGAYARLFNLQASSYLD